MSRLQTFKDVWQAMYGDSKEAEDARQWAKAKREEQSKESYKELHREEREKETND